MKKIGAWLLVLVFIFGMSASAQTLSAVPVWIDDGEMYVTMELYENDMGISMAYDPAYFLVNPEEKDVIRFIQTPSAFISFQDLNDMSVEDAANGLALQSKTDECAVNDAGIGGLFSEPIPATAVLYEEIVEDTTYQHCFYLVSKGANTLMVECFYPTTIDAVVGAILTTMLQTITVSE